MQSSSGINALLAAATTPASHGANAALQDEDGAPSQAFSQLLSDFGAHADGQAPHQFAQGTVLQAGGAHVLAAQEVDLSALIGKPVGPETLITSETATQMLPRIEAMIAQSGAENNAALLQIKTQLNLIVQSNVPQTLAAVLAAAPAVKDAASVPALVLSALQEVKTPAVAVNDVVGAAETEEAPEQVLAAMQNLPAQLFRAPVGENKGEAAAAPKEKKKERDYVETVVVMEPVAFASVTAAPVEADISIASATTVRPDLDQLVPPLKPREEKTELPDIDLPKMAAPVADKNAVAPAAKSSEQAETKTTKASHDTLAAINNILGADANISATNATNLVNPLAHVATTHAASALKTVNLVTTPGLVNHAPVTDQVHVAINQASKDGLDRITIQLDPLDLGRVEINMHTNKEGHTQLYFTVDKPETFDNLSRDARMLERSLQEAGIKADTGSMQFNLRQQPQQQQLQSDMNGNGQPKQQPQTEDETKQSAVTGVQSSAAFARNYILNIRDGVDISA